MTEIPLTSTEDIDKAYESLQQYEQQVDKLIVLQTQILSKLQIGLVGVEKSSFPNANEILTFTELFKGDKKNSQTTLLNDLKFSINGFIQKIIITPQNPFKN